MDVLSLRIHDHYSIETNGLLWHINESSKDIFTFESAQNGTQFSVQNEGRLCTKNVNKESVKITSSEKFSIELIDPLRHIYSPLKNTINENAFKFKCDPSNSESKRTKEIILKCMKEIQEIMNQENSQDDFNQEKEEKIQKELQESINKALNSLQDIISIQNVKENDKNEKKYSIDVHMFKTYLQKKLKFNINEKKFNFKKLSFNSNILDNFEEANYFCLSEELILHSHDENDMKKIEFFCGKIKDLDSIESLFNWMDLNGKTFLYRIVESNNVSLLKRLLKLNYEVDIASLNTSCYNGSQMNTSVMQIIYERNIYDMEKVISTHLKERKKLNWMYRMPWGVQWKPILFADITLNEYLRIKMYDKPRNFEAKNEHSLYIDILNMTFKNVFGVENHMRYLIDEKEMDLFLLKQKNPFNESLLNVKWQWSDSDSESEVCQWYDFSEEESFSITKKGFEYHGEYKNELWDMEKRVPDCDVKKKLDFKRFKWKSTDGIEKEGRIRRFIERERETTIPGAKEVPTSGIVNALNLMDNQKLSTPLYEYGMCKMVKNEKEVLIIAFGCINNGIFNKNIYTFNGKDLKELKCYELKSMKFEDIQLNNHEITLGRDNRIYSFGGKYIYPKYNNRVLLNSNPTKVGKWDEVKVKTSIDIPIISNFSSLYCRKRNCIYLFGGNNAKDANENIYKVTHDDNDEMVFEIVFSSGNEIPEARWGHSMHWIDDTENAFIIFGGRIKSTFKCVNDVYMFDVETGVWYKKADKVDLKPPGREKFGAVVYENELIIHGGRRGVLYRKCELFHDFYKLDLKKWTWKCYEIVKQGQYQNLGRCCFKMDYIMVNNTPRFFCFGGMNVDYLSFKNNPRLGKLVTKIRYSNDIFYFSFPQKLIKSPRKTITGEIYTTEIPGKYICPISQDIMREPVNLECLFHSFEKKMIEELFKRKEGDFVNCPTCRRNVEKKYTPNKFQQKEIENWRETHKIKSNFKYT